MWIRIRIEKSLGDSSGYKFNCLAENFSLIIFIYLSIYLGLVTGKVADLRDLAEVKKPVRTALMSKQYGYEDFLADLVVNACGKNHFGMICAWYLIFFVPVTVMPKNEKNFNVDNVRVCKILVRN